MQEFRSRSAVVGEFSEQARLPDRERGAAFLGVMAAVAIAAAALAVVALPSFAVERNASPDVSARTHAVGAVNQVEACYSARQDYRACVAPTLLASDGVGVGRRPGEISVSAPSQTAYRIVATSAAPGRNGAPHTIFTISKDSAGSTRTCSTPGVGGCDPAGRW